ncbi:MAG: hypothetical protein EOP86_20035, partial [Verrucomicrobiaceae bacterium]
MKRLWLALLPCFWILPAAAAEKPLPFFNDLPLTDGRKLEKVQVLKIEPDGLRVEHAHGAGKVPMEVLPADVIKRFNFNETDAADWREAEKKRKDEAAARGREEAVERMTATARAEQEEQVRRQRLALYQQMRGGTLNYVDADTALRKSIELYTQAGREDLAGILQEDRQLLKQQEIYRPSAELEKQKEELANRVTQLEADLTNARNQPPLIISQPDPFLISPSIYYNPTPIYIPVPGNPLPTDCPPGPRPPVGRPPLDCPPGTVTPPVVRPPWQPGPTYPSNGPSVLNPRQPQVQQPAVQQPQVPPIRVRPPQVPQPSV